MPIDELANTRKNRRRPGSVNESVEDVSAENVGDEGRSTGATRKKSKKSEEKVKELDSKVKELGPSFRNVMLDFADNIKETRALKLVVTALESKVSKLENDLQTSHRELLFLKALTRTENVDADEVMMIPPITIHHTISIPLAEDTWPRDRKEWSQLRYLNEIVEKSDSSCGFKRWNQSKINEGRPTSLRVVHGCNRRINQNGKGKLSISFVPKSVDDGKVLYKCDVNRKTGQTCICGFQVKFAPESLIYDWEPPGDEDDADSGSGSDDSG